MLDMATTGVEPVEAGEYSARALSQVEHRLIQRYRQMSEQERRQVRRLVELLATNPEDLDP